MFKKLIITNKRFIFVFLFSFIFIYFNPWFTEEKTQAFLSNVFFFLLFTFSYKIISMTKKVVIYSFVFLTKMLLSILLLIAILMIGEHFSGRLFFLFYILLYFLYSGVFYFQVLKINNETSK